MLGRASLDRFSSLIVNPENERDMFFEKLVDFQWTIWHYIPEDGTYHNYRCHNLKSYMKPCSAYFYNT